MKLNLGSGEHPEDGWVNIDAVTRGRVDVLADVRALPFARGSIQAIYAGHLVEHMFPAESRHAIRHWWSLLAPAGRLGILVPDLQRIWRTHREISRWTDDMLGGAIGRPERDPEDPFAGHVTVWTLEQLRDFVIRTLDLEFPPDDMDLYGWPVNGPEWDWQVGVVAVKP